MGATMLKDPEFALQPIEAKKLSEAIGNVQAHYPDSQIDPKIMAWIGLTVTGGMIYAPRIARLAKARKTSPAPKTQAQNTGPVDPQGQPQPSVAAAPKAKGGTETNKGPVTPAQLYGFAGVEE